MGGRLAVEGPQVSRRMPLRGGAVSRCGLSSGPTPHEPVAVSRLPSGGGGSSLLLLPLPTWEGPQRLAVAQRAFDGQEGLGLGAVVGHLAQTLPASGDGR